MTRDYIAHFLRGWTRLLFVAAALNGARMPSIAEELATDLSTIFSRSAGSLRNRLVVVIGLAILQHCKRKKT